MNRKSTNTAILVPVIAILVSGIVLLIVIVGIRSASTAHDLTEEVISARVDAYANEFSALCMEPYGSVNSLPSILLDIRRNRTGDIRQEAVGILSDVLMNNDNVISVWTCWEPDAFDRKDADYVNRDYHDGTGRFVPVVYREGSGYGLEALSGYDDPAEGDYYFGAVNAGAPYMPDPYPYMLNGVETLLFTISFPIIQDGETLGVVGADISLESVMSIINNDILDGGYWVTLSPSGYFSTHPDEHLLLTHYSETWMGGYRTEVDSLLSSGGRFSVQDYSEIMGDNIVMQGAGVRIGNTRQYWMICGLVPQSTVNRSAVSLVVLMAVIGAVLIVVIGCCVAYIVKRRLRELPYLTAVAEAMAEGNVDMAVGESGDEPTKNEIALLKRAFQKMGDAIREQAAVMSKIADGDYTVNLAVRSASDVMNRSVNHMIESNNQMITEIRTSSTQVAGGAQQIASASQSLASGSTEQASTISQFTAAIQHVQQKTEENAANASASMSSVQQAVSLMDECIQNMGRMTSAMEDINARSANISKVIKAIDDIAFQTNILALNAAVEAARAGQHGKGFVVVANEVRSLAAKSAEAAMETEELINESIQSVRAGNDILEKTGESLQAVGRIADLISRSSGEINDSTQEQSRSMAEIHKGLAGLSTVVEANAATAEEAAAAAEEMHAQAAVLNDIVSRFLLDDNAHGHPARRARADAPGAASPGNGFSLSAHSQDR